MENLQLLLVEDDLDLAKAIVDYLALEDIQCDHAANGLSGLNLIQQGQYDTVILDLNLPKMNGLEVCARLREQGIDVPVLMLTAKDTLDDKLTGFSKGADDYLVKPFAMEELIIRAQVLSRRRRHCITKRVAVARVTAATATPAATTSPSTCASRSRATRAGCRPPCRACPPTTAATAPSRAWRRSTRA